MYDVNFCRAFKMGDKIANCTCLFFEWCIKLCQLENAHAEGRSNLVTKLVKLTCPTVNQISTYHQLFTLCLHRLLNKKSKVGNLVPNTARGILCIVLLIFLNHLHYVLILSLGQVF